MKLLPELSPRRSSMPFPGTGAFTLVELLVVMGIIVVLVALTVPTLGSLNARSLESSGNQIVDLATQARQNSMTKGVMTALVFVTGSTDPTVNNRLLLMLQFSPGAAAWVPVTKWYTLATGVVIDPTQSGTFIQQSPTLPVPLGSLTRGNTSFAQGTYAYQVFLPNGQVSVSGLTTPVPPTLRLVQGAMNQTTLVRTGNPANYYDVILNLYTGIAKVDRP